MSDATVKKVSARTAPAGAMGQRYLATGKRVSMRLWEEAPEEGGKHATKRAYETIGYVVSGRAELVLEGQTIRLEPGDSWLVPPDAEHTYRILEPFVAVEATSPPAEVHGRDEA